MGPERSLGGPGSEAGDAYGAADSVQGREFQAGGRWELYPLHGFERNLVRVGQHRHDGRQNADAGQTLGFPAGNWKTGVIFLSLEGWNPFS